MMISFCFQMEFSGVIALSTKQPNKLISAEAELDANQVKARCRNWRKTAITSEKRAARSNGINSRLHDSFALANSVERGKGPLLAFQVF